MAVFKRILAATDFSEASGRALELAVAMARESGAELHVVHACEIPASYGEFATSIDLVTPYTEVAEKRLGELIRSLRDVIPGTRSILREGAAWEQILAAADEVGADLIVVGTHGRRGAVHAILGSVAERVARLSEIPVLIVRSRAAPKRAAAQ
jgi:nucleotide-binding universal stress UspA family protein